jgi:dihydroorotase
MPMVQFSLPAMLGLVDEGVLSITRLVQLMCHNPAETFQIENRGYLREGYKADLVVVRPDSPWTLTPNQIESKCNWSPLEGRVFRHRVEKTFVNGYLLYNNGHITDYDHTGEAVTYNR